MLPFEVLAAGSLELRSMLQQCRVAFYLFFFQVHQYDVEGVQNIRQVSLWYHPILAVVV